MNQRLMFTQVIFYCLIFAGCTQLSLLGEAGKIGLNRDNLLWIVPFVAGIAGWLFTTVFRQARSSKLYGAPTIVFGIVVSAFFPSMFTRILVLLVFASLVLWMVVRAASKQPASA